MLEKVNEQLQKNPIIVLIMFVISVLGGTITIILGWKDFYDNYLSHNFTIPVWLILILCFSGALLYLFKPDKKIIQKELETVEGQFFGVQQVILDGKRFVNCTFDGSELVFKGKNGFSLESNTFETMPRITFTENAGTTLTVLKALQQDPSFRNFISQTFL